VFGIHPDLTVEILSPDQNATKVISNILHLKYGTQLGWFIDPEERLVFSFSRAATSGVNWDDRLPAPKFLELDLTVAQVFGWLKAGN